MTKRNSIKIAAVIACMIFALWLLISLTVCVFQNEIIGSMIVYSYMEATEDKIMLWSNLAQIILSIPIAAGCGMVMKEKGGTLPLVLAIVPSVLMPLVSGLAGTSQSIAIGRIYGAAMLQKYAVIGSLYSWISYLLNVACIVAVAAAAVHYYAVKCGHLTQNPHENEEENI